MGMPNNLIFVRHGHSEGNLAVESAKSGDESFYTPDFRERPGHRWRLTENGVDQAKKTGDWIHGNIGTSFDKYYVSSYIRTRETAAYLKLENAEWRIAQRLRERDWGDIGSQTRGEHQELYPHNAFQMKADRLYWRPPGGESIADVRLRARDFFDTMHRECDGKNVIVVTHGEFMWAVRAELEYLHDERWLEMDEDESEKIYNTQILHYSRLNPKTNQQSPSLNWRRSVCAWKDGHDTGWIEIKKQFASNADLIEQVETVKPLIQ